METNDLLWDAITWRRGTRRAAACMANEMEERNHAGFIRTWRATGQAPAAAYEIIARVWPPPCPLVDFKRPQR